MSLVVLAADTGLRGDLRLRALSQPEEGEGSQRASVLTARFASYLCNRGSPGEGRRCLETEQKGFLWTFSVCKA